MRNLVLLAAVLASLLSIHAEAASVDAESQTITIALAQEPPQLNGMKATDQVSIRVLSHSMEGLTRYDRRGNLAPGVATRWEVDDKKATFWLREDAKWSNGDPVSYTHLTLPTISDV